MPDTEAIYHAKHSRDASKVVWRLKDVAREEGRGKITDSGLAKTAGGRRTRLEIDRDDGDAACPRWVADRARKTTPPVPPPEPEILLRPGQRFHSLEIVRLVGRGGMGVVSQDRQPALDRFVALKLLPLKLALDPEFQNLTPTRERARVVFPTCLGPPTKSSFS